MKSSGKSKKRTIIKTISLCLIMALYIISSLTIILPYYKTERLNKAAQNTATSFIQHTEKDRLICDKISTELISKPAESFEDYIQNNASSIPYSDLLLDMLSYNKQIRDEKQSGLSDAFSYASECFDLSGYGLDNEVVATVDIPALDTTFPLYLGANAEHLNVGLAQLTETSMPIGGIGTNCVIAGHRGWSNGKYLKEIENIKVGDIITITNIWYEMKYQVCEIRIIDKSDIAQILIDADRDLITLMTCHPYGTGGRYYRYLVICERMPNETPLGYTTTANEIEYAISKVQIDNDNNLNTSSQAEITTPHIQYFSSEKEIFRDDLFHYIGFGIILLFPIIVIFILIRNRHNKRKQPL